MTAPTIAQTGRAGLYLRMSMATDTEGVDRQERAVGSTYVERRGWTVDYVLSDNSRSANGKTFRPDFEKLLDLINAEKIDVIVSAEVPRLTRNRYDMCRLMDACEAHGVNVSCLNGGEFDMSTPMGQHYFEQAAGYGKLESKVKGFRQRLANHDRAKRGILRLGTPRSFGWMEDKLTPHPTEGPAVTEAFATVLGGGSRRSIVAKWNDSGLKPPQGASEWNTVRVTQVLRNPRHAGLTGIGGEVLGEIEGAAKLVTREAYEAVQGILADKKRASHVRGVKSIFGGIALCPCGGRVTKAKSPRGFSIYRHQPAPGTAASDCYHVARRSDAVDRYIEEVVIDRLTRPNAKELLLDVVGPENIDALRDRKQALEEKLNAYVDDELNGRITRDQLIHATTKVRDDIAEIEAGLTDASRLDVLGEVINSANGRKTWKSLHVDRKRAIIRMLFAEIILHSPGMGRCPKPEAETIELKWVEWAE